LAAPSSTVASVHVVEKKEGWGSSIARERIMEGRGAAQIELVREGCAPIPLTAASRNRACWGPRLVQIRGKRVVAIIPPMLWEDLSDEALIARYHAEANKAQAAEYVNELFRRHHVKVAWWCLSVTGNRESAADLAQEICVKACRNLSCFKAQSKFSTWLYSITRNHCLNSLRSKASALELHTDETVMEALPDMDSDNPLASVERKQQAEIARQLINQTLDETEKTVFTLHFGEELPLDAITRMLKLKNASGAKAYLVSAKRKLDRAVRRWKARA